MNRWFWSLLYCWVTVATLTAQPIAVETFTYNEMVRLPGLGAAENGWAGSWETVEGDAGSAGIAAEGIEMTGLLRRTARSRAVLSASDFAPRTFQRRLAIPHTAESGPLWVGFSSGADFENLLPDAKLGLIDLGYPDHRAARLTLGKHYGRNLITADGAGIYPMSSGKGYQTGRWTVAAIYPAAPGRWKAYVWVDPDRETSPDTTTAMIRGLSIRAEQFDGVWLQITAGPGLEWSVDDVYLGRDFGAVVPEDWEAVSPEELGAAREPFDYPDEVVLGGQGGGRGFLLPWLKVGGTEFRVRNDAFTVADTLNTLPNLLDLDYDGGTGVRYVRPLALPFSYERDEYWLGANISIDFSNENNVAQLFLARTGQLGASGPGGQLFQIGKAFGNSRFSIGRPGEYTFLEEVSAAGNYFVLIRARPNPTTMRVNFALWIDPAPGLPPSDLFIASAVTVPMPEEGWDAIGVKVEGNPGIRFRVDDLGFGPQYADAIPPRWLEEPSASLNQIPLVDRVVMVPNPGGDSAYLSVHTTGPLRGRCALYASNGKRLRVRPFDWLAGGDHRVPVGAMAGGLPRGNYRVVIRSGEGKVNVNWVKL